MPIYDFVCCECSDKFDRLVKYDWRSAGVVCPNCGSTKLEKAVSRVGAIASGGKMEMLDHNHGHGCSTCGTGACGTCH